MAGCGPGGAGAANELFVHRREQGREPGVVGGLVGCVVKLLVDPSALGEEVRVAHRGEVGSFACHALSPVGVWWRFLAPRRRGRVSVGDGGMFTALVEAAETSTSAYPSWFQSWVDAEKRASVLRSWEPLIVPGPLQTAEYARAIFEVWRAVDGNRDVDRDVAARLARQDIFDRPAPPSFGVVIDETVLRRCVGGAKVMLGQLLHLVEMSERPRVSVQILPAEVGEHVGLGGAFAVASFVDDTPGMVYFETADEGEVTKVPARLERTTVIYDALRDDALNARASRDLMRKVAEERWKV